MQLLTTIKEIYKDKRLSESSKDKRLSESSSQTRQLYKTVDNSSSIITQSAFIVKRQ
jgi:hypothetical protein